jgi:transglutaminase-like putative cysteine protease
MGCRVRRGLMTLFFACEGRMGRSLRCLAVVLLASALLTACNPRLAQRTSFAPAPSASAETAAPVRHADPTYVVKSLAYNIEVHPDGSSVEIVHAALQPKNEVAAQQLAQQPTRYAKSRQRVEVLGAYTLKPDGRRLKVDPESIQTEPVPGAPDLSLYDDQRQKVILFPSVGAGDVFVSTVKYIDQPYFPGFFTRNFVFNRTVAYDDVRVTVTAPAAMALLTETHGMAFTKRRAGDKIVYQWQYANPDPLPEKIQALDDHDVAPRFAISSFRSYAELARRYAQLTDKQAVVTPAIRALAGKITAGVSDKRKQAELIYDWVSRHIRYVALELGQAALVAHPADLVLSNGFGDCKDHAILFSALLRAKGIASATALINLGKAYSLSEVPTLGSLNHAITWLPDFALYADTTAGVAPFGVLPFGEYGKPVIIADASHPAVQHTPILAPGSASLVLKTTARLHSDGRLEWQSESTATGAFSVTLREVAISISAKGPERAASDLLRKIGLFGSGAFEFTSPYVPSPSYSISESFSLNAIPELLSGESFVPAFGVELGPRPGDFLLGDVTFPDFQGSEPTPCFSGSQEEEVALELPPGRTLRRLPEGVTIRGKYVHYQSRWSFSGRTVTVRRVFSTQLDQPLCAGKLRRTAAQMLGIIRADYDKTIALSSR